MLFPRPLHLLFLLTPSVLFYPTTSSPPITLVHSTAERENKSGRLSVEEEVQVVVRSLQRSWELTSTMRKDSWPCLHRERESRWFSGGSRKRWRGRIIERARGVHEMEWSNIQCYKVYPAEPFQAPVAVQSVVTWRCRLRHFISHSNFVLCLWSIYFRTWRHQSKQGWSCRHLASINWLCCPPSPHLHSIQHFSGSCCHPSNWRVVVSLHQIAILCSNCRPLLSNQGTLACGPSICQSCT